LNDQYLYRVQKLFRPSSKLGCIVLDMKIEQDVDSQYHSSRLQGEAAEEIGACQGLAKESPAGYQRVQRDMEEPVLETPEETLSEKCHCEPILPSVIDYLGCDG
jgi:hypothetical protein